MLNILKALKPFELKIFLIIMTKCNERYEYANQEKISEEFEISYPVVLKNIDRLEKKLCINKIDTGNECILRISNKLRYLVDHLKRTPNQLELFAEDFEAKIPKKWWNKRDENDLIRHYSVEQGVPSNKYKEWCRANYARNITAAGAMLDYCGNLEAALKAVTNCRIERSRNKLNWSLSGDVRRNIQNYAPKLSEIGEKKWHG